MRLFDLSLRYKLPLWGGLLILVSVLAVSAALMVKAYEDLREDLRISAEGLAYTLNRTLFPALLHDDVWRAFEQIDAAMVRRGGVEPIRPESIFVVDDQARVVVSSEPYDLPMLAYLPTLGPDYAGLAQALGSVRTDELMSVDFSGSGRIFFVLPIHEESARLGTLVLAYSKDVFLPRFRSLALQGALIGLIILAVLLPLNWYWGRRMAEPLVELAEHMGRVAGGSMDGARQWGYPYRDELGQLFAAFEAMLAELRAKARLENELLAAERLSAIGRLASGIAHEVNNPLGGMLMSLDTLKTRGELPEHVARTLSLLERGLKQIQATVSALLVQAREQGRTLGAQDLEDVRTLIQPQVLKKSQRLTWEVALPEGLRLPANAVRQVLINLLLNAVQATAEQGHIALSVAPAAGGLSLTVRNEAEPIPNERLEHLFEPFVTGREGGHGLGLWVTYQIVQQLGGRIGVECADGEVRFEVWLPKETRT